MNINYKISARNTQNSNKQETMPFFVLFIEYTVEFANYICYQFIDLKIIKTISL